jgi:hypothetical protein
VEKKKRNPDMELVVGQPHRAYTRIKQPRKHELWEHIARVDYHTTLALEYVAVVQHDMGTLAGLLQDELGNEYRAGNPIYDELKRLLDIQELTREHLARTRPPGNIEGTMPEVFPVRESDRVPYNGEPIHREVDDASDNE